MARTFSGTAQCLSATGQRVSALPFSMAAWFKPNSTSGTQTILSQSSTGTANHEDQIDMLSAKLRALFGGGVSPSSVASMTTAAWFHCAAVFTSGASVSYLNGVAATSSGSNTMISQTTTSIAAFFNGTSTAANLANGSIAFAAIWSIALSAADITSLYTGLASPRIVHPEALVSYVRLAQGDSPEPDFISSTTWTLTGSPTLSINPLIYKP